MISVFEKHNSNGMKSSFVILATGLIIITSIKYMYDLCQKRRTQKDENTRQDALKNEDAAVKPTATRKEWRVAVLGLSGSGKTSVVVKSFGKSDTDTDRSPSNKKSLNVFCKEIDGYSLFLWEFCHIEQAKKHWFKFVNKHSGTLMFVVDCSVNIDKLIEAKDHFYEIMCSDHITGIPVILVANKQDVAGSINGQDLKNLFNLEELKGVVHSVDVVETGLNVDYIQHHDDEIPGDEHPSSQKCYETDYQNLVELMKQHYINHKAEHLRNDEEEDEPLDEILEMNLIAEMEKELHEYFSSINFIGGQ